MTSKIKIGRPFSGHRIIFAVVLCLFALFFIQSNVAYGKRHKVRKVDDRVYLIHADQLKYDLYGPNPDAQIVKGHVSFRHKGAHLSCDSAYFYEASNSFEAFGHVKMRQSDTLTLTCDHAFYDGDQEVAHARKNVVLRHRSSKLFCDSLDYDRMYNYGYFFEGGKLIDKGNVLTSDWGEYNTKNRQAVFYYNVHLKNPKYVLNSDTLYYDTRKSLAHIVGPSVIKSGQSIIHSSMGYFDTHNNKAQLFGRSTVDNKGKTITGDSLYYNSKTGVSRGYRNVVCVDKIHKNKITCNHFFYNEKTGYAFATDNPVAMDYSQKDTLYVHADTMKLFTFHINTDSVYRKMHAYHKVRAFRVDMQAVCDSLVLNSKDSSMVMYKDPIVWSDNRQLLGEVINVFMNDSTIRFAHIVGQALSIEQMKDSVHFNQIASKEMKAYFIDGNLRKSQAEGNVRSVYYPTDSKDSSLIGLNYTETDTMKMYINTLRKLDKIWTSKVDCTMYPMTQIPPNMYKLPNFAWFDYIRPLNKDDIYVWRAKKADAILRPEKRREAPVQYIDREKGASQ